MDMDEYSIVYSIHVLKRMAERYIREEEVVYAISSGVTIEAYVDDTPHSSELLLCYSEGAMCSLPYYGLFNRSCSRII